MVRNLRPGPDWIPGVIVEVLGPVTYLIETEEGLRWKRHTDQLKSWITPAPEMRPVLEPRTVENPVSEPSEQPSSDEEDEMSLGGATEPIPGAQETPEAVNPPVPPPPGTPEPTEPTRSYPTRVRQPPDRYHDQYQ